MALKMLRPQNARSVNTYFRKRRFAQFRQLLDRLPRPLKILDIGGTDFYWERMGFTDAPGVSVELFNLHLEQPRYPMFTAQAGTATDLSRYADQSFDLVYSNSCIEHVGGLAEQRKMAAEVRRVGKHYFVQTPNYWFPFEPHFLFPGFQYLPSEVRATLLQHMPLGHHHKTPDRAEAEETVGQVRLLTASELKRMFPEGTLLRERLGPLTKSLTVHTLPGT